RLGESLSAAFGVLLGWAAHAVGWPIPRGGAQSITNALCSHLSRIGGIVTTARRVYTLSAVPHYDVALCDVTPRQLLRLAKDRLSEGYKRQLATYRYGPGVFKVDYALEGPIPWKAPDCLRAATVHLGGSIEEIAASEEAMRHERHEERPFVVLAQPRPFDRPRGPECRDAACAG